MQTTDAPRPGTTHPHLARERALKVLFAADVRGVDPRVLLDEVATRPADLELLDELEPDQEQVAGDEELQLELTRRRRLPLDDYTRDLVAGVAARRSAIDDVLGEVADRWPVHRMPALDRNLLRLAVYELAEQDTPDAVVIDEAVSLAIAFAGEKARGFVNGVLETVRQQVVAGEVSLTVTAVAAEDAPVSGSDDDPSEPTDVDVAAASRQDDLDGADDVDDVDDLDDIEEVDPAAQEAYDLALDLLDGEGDFDAWGDTSADDDDRFADVSLDDEDLDDDLAEQLGLDDELRDEDDALW